MTDIINSSSVVVDGWVEDSSVEDIVKVQDTMCFFPFYEFVDYRFLELTGW